MEENPHTQIAGFLRLVGAITAIILSGLALVMGLAWYFRPSEATTMPRQGDAVTRLPQWRPADTREKGGDPLNRDLENARVLYSHARTDLEGALETAAGAAVPLQEDIGVVEGAIRDIVFALTMNPDSESLKQTLMDMYGRELALLRKTLRLADKEPGAAKEPDTAPDEPAGPSP